MATKDDFLVNFLIAGTQKGGTTALVSFLSQHPEICMALKKEPHFFDSETYAKCESDAEIAKAYRRHFPDPAGRRLVGEATPIYMFIPGIAERIHHYNPAMKLICILRDPVERAISHHSMEKNRGREERSLPVALLAEAWRIRGWRTETVPSQCTRVCSYLSRGFYSKQLENLYRYFPPSQIHVITTEDLWDRHEESLVGIYKFLGVADQTIIPPQQRVFATEAKSPVPRATRLLLNMIYRKEVSRLSAALNRDLSDWC